VTVDFSRDAFETAAVNVGNALLAFAVGVTLARRFGDVGRGVLTAATLWPSVALIIAYAGLPYAPPTSSPVTGPGGVPSGELRPSPPWSAAPRWRSSRSSPSTRCSPANPRPCGMLPESSASWCCSKRPVL
jgi:hypothetical protein